MTYTENKGQLREGYLKRLKDHDFGNKGPNEKFQILLGTINIQEEQRKALQQWFLDLGESHSIIVPTNQQKEVIGSWITEVLPSLLTSATKENIETEFYRLSQQRFYGIIFIGNNFEELGSVSIDKEEYPIAIDITGRLRIFKNPYAIGTNREYLNFAREIANLKAENGGISEGEKLNSIANFLGFNPAINNSLFQAFQKEFNDPNKENSKLQIETWNYENYASGANENPDISEEEWITANIDPTTGLFNRNGYRVVENYITNQKKITAMSFDSDRFKAMNDFLGREYCDDIIRVIGQEFFLLQKALTEKGYMAVAIHGGGDEFFFFTNAPRNVYEDDLNKMHKNIKERIIEFLNSFLPNKIWEIIVEEYLKLTKNVTNAGKEVGGSTLGVVSANFSNINHKDPSEILHILIQMADGILENGKSNRGNIHYSKAPDASERILSWLNKERNATEVRNGNFSQDSNNRLQQKKEEVLEEKWEYFFEQLDSIDCNDAVVAFIRNTFNDDKTLFSYLLSPQKDSKIEEKYPDKIENITNARKVCNKFFQTYEPQLFTANANSIPEGYEISAKISINQFKAVNETLGHENADMFLQILALRLNEKLAEFEADIKVVKNIADFEIYITKDTRNELIKILDKINEIFEKEYWQIFIEELREKLFDWLEENKSPEDINRFPPGKLTYTACQ